MEDAAFYPITNPKQANYHATQVHNAVYVPPSRTSTRPTSGSSQAPRQTAADLPIMALLEVERPPGLVRHPGRRRPRRPGGLLRGRARHRPSAIVGESGSGKSVGTQTITGLTRGAQIAGTAFFDGIDLLQAERATLRRVRGRKIGMIFQDPLSSLHPHYRVGWQIVEMIRAHDRTISKAAARRRAADLLGLVGIPHATDRIDDYPHQFSGGMRQRVMIAMAMALNPALLIADEPTTALDVTVQAQVLRVMRQAPGGVRHGDHPDHPRPRRGRRDGRRRRGDVRRPVMERAPRRELFYRHHHPYTEGLLASLPARGADTRLTPIPGTPPSLINPPPRLPVRSALPVRLRPVRGGDAAPGPVFGTTTTPRRAGCPPTRRSASTAGSSCRPARQQRPARESHERPASTGTRVRSRR